MILSGISFKNIKVCDRDTKEVLYEGLLYDYFDQGYDKVYKNRNLIILNGLKACDQLISKRIISKFNSNPIAEQARLVANFFNHTRIYDGDIYLLNLTIKNGNIKPSYINDCTWLKKFIMHFVSKKLNVTKLCFEFNNDVVNVFVMIDDKIQAHCTQEYYAHIMHDYENTINKNIIGLLIPTELILKDVLANIDDFKYECNKYVNTTNYLYSISHEFNKAFGIKTYRFKNGLYAYVKRDLILMSCSYISIFDKLGNELFKVFFAGTDEKDPRLYRCLLRSGLSFTLTIPVFVKTTDETTLTVDDIFRIPQIRQDIGNIVSAKMIYI